MHSTIDFRTPAAGFDQPLQMWQACHERVARMNRLLEKLVDHLDGHAIDDDAIATAASVRRYFDEAAPRHHDDEDEDLFPRLIARLKEAGDEAGAARIGSVITSLQQDHAEIGALWTDLREPLARIERGEAPRFDRPQVATFIRRYRAHIALEDAEIAPALAARLTEADRQEIGRAMAARRGVNWQEIVGAGLQR